MDLELRGRVVLVVGGTGLIGRAVVERLRAEGATAVVAARGVENGVENAVENAVRDAVRLDARDPESVRTGFDRVRSQHGRLDGLVVTAAPSAQTLDASRNADPEQALEAFDAKAMVFLRLANAVLPAMTAAKNLADAVAGTGVTVNTVSPGTVSETPATEVAPGRGGESSPRQIADLVAFLVSPLAAAVSGESIAVGHRVRGVTSF